MAWTDYTSPAVDAVTGVVAPAALWNTYVVDNGRLLDRHLIVRKSADESVTSSTTMQDDNHLVLPVLANEVWRFEFNLLYSAATTGDFKVGVTFPTGGRFDAGAIGLDSSSATAYLTWSDTTSPSIAKNFGGLGSTTRIPISVYGIYTNGGTGGNLQLQWAQTTSDATATTVYTNSTLWAVKLA